MRPWVLGLTSTSKKRERRQGESKNSKRKNKIVWYLILWGMIENYEGYLKFKNYYSKRHEAMNPPAPRTPPHSEHTCHCVFARCDQWIPLPSVSSRTALCPGLPYSPDLTLCNCWLHPKVKMPLWEVVLEVFFHEFFGYAMVVAWAEDLPLLVILTLGRNQKLHGADVVTKVDQDTTVLHTWLLWCQRHCAATRIVFLITSCKDTQKTSQLLQKVSRRRGYVCWNRGGISKGGLMATCLLL